MGYRVAVVGADPYALRLRMIFLFKPHHANLKIPFSDLTATPRKLMLMNMVELAPARTPGVKILIAKSRADWIFAQSSGALKQAA